MVKPQNKNTVPTSFSNSFKKWPKMPKFWVALAGVLVISVVLGLFTVRQIKINTEKRDFMQKQSQIESIANQIADQNPLSTKQNYQYCRYQSRKFEKGDLYCSVVSKVTFRDIDIVEANILLKEIQNSLNIQFSLPSMQRDIENVVFTENSSEHKEQSFIAYIDPENKVCDIGAYYDTGRSSNKDFIVGLSCTKIARAEYFPVR